MLKHEYVQKVVRWGCWILKTVSYEPVYQWIKGRNVWEKECTAMFKWLFFFKMKNNFNRSVTRWDFCAIFCAQYLRFWEQGLKGILSCHLRESIEIDVLFYGHHWVEPCLTQITILKKYKNFKCALRQRWKLFTQSTPKFGKSQLQAINLEQSIVQH